MSAGVALSLGVAAPGLAACGGGGGARLRYDYPVVLKGPPELFGARVDGVAAFAYGDGVFTEVPVQVDEVNAQGDYVLNGGLPFTRATDDGRFDANDELVLDGTSLGDDFDPAAVKLPDLGKGKSFKLELCRGERAAGYLLIVALERGRPSPFATAVRFEPSKPEVESPLYRYRFNARHPALLGEVLLRQPGGERPVIRDSRFRMPLKTPFFVPDMTFGEDDFTSAIESWQTGPLRTVVAVGVKYSAFLSLLKLHLFSELVFYKNRFVIPTVIEFVFDPASLLKPGSGIAYSLRFPEGRGFVLDGNLTPLPEASPAQVVESGRTAAGTDVFVVRGHGPDGAFLVQVRVDPRARASVPPPFLIGAAEFASPRHRALWPWLAELSGDVGIYLDFSRVHRGMYDFGLDLLLSPEADQTFTEYGPVDSSWQPLPAR